MKKYFFLLFILFFCTQLLLAQRIPYVVLEVEKKADKRVSEEHNFRNLLEADLLIPMDFDNYIVSDGRGLNKIYDMKVSEITLFYSNYRKNDYDPGYINRLRLLTLYNICPGLFNDDRIKWNIVGQEPCATIGAAKYMFNGFILKHERVGSVREEEMYSTKKGFEETIKTKIQDEQTIVNSKMPTNKVNVERIAVKYKPKPKVLTNSIEETDESKDSYETPEEIRALLEEERVEGDSIVFETMERTIDNFQGALVVADWTGSMYDYGIQLLVWLKLHENKREKFTQFVFFNDGDSTITKDKIIGQTGGIYMTQGNKTEDIIDVMVQCVKGGYGGERAENDIEALIYGMTRRPDCKDVVLIADSKSEVRDIALLPELKRIADENGQSVSVILCDSKEIISEEVLVQYLNIAKSTINGSVYTMEKDIQNLAKSFEGDEIEILGFHFKIQDGQFIPIDVK